MTRVVPVGDPAVIGPLTPLPAAKAAAGPVTRAVYATIEARRLSVEGEHFCTSPDGLHRFADETYEGTSAGDPELTGRLVIEVHSADNVTSGYLGLATGQARIFEPGTGRLKAVADVTAVDSPCAELRGMRVDGFVSGHVLPDPGSPAAGSHAKVLFANFSARLEPNGALVGNLGADGPVAPRSTAVVQDVITRFTAPTEGDLQMMPGRRVAGGKAALTGIVEKGPQGQRVKGERLREIRNGANAPHDSWIEFDCTPEDQNSVPFGPMPEGAEVNPEWAGQPTFDGDPDTQPMRLLFDYEGDGSADLVHEYANHGCTPRIRVKTGPEESGRISNLRFVGPNYGDGKPAVIPVRPSTVNVGRTRG